MMKLISKKPEEKEKNKYSEEEVDWYKHHLQNTSYQKIYTFRYCVAIEVPSTSSQIFEQIEVIQVLLGISKLNDSASDKKPGDQTHTHTKTNLFVIAY